MQTLDFPIGDALDDQPGYRELCERTDRLGLPRVEFTSQEHGLEVRRIYLCHPEEQWRVEAHRALLHAHAGRYWSEAAERLEGYLLGYSQESIDTWSERMARGSAGWGLSTLYMLVKDGFCEQAAQVGAGCILEPMLDEIVERSVFFLADRALDPRLDLDPELRLVRFGARHKVRKLLYGADVGGKAVLARRLEPELLPPLNYAMSTKLELWKGGRWTRLSPKAP